MYLEKSDEMLRNIINLGLNLMSFFALGALCCLVAHWFIPMPLITYFIVGIIAIIILTWMMSDDFIVDVDANSTRLARDPLFPKKVEIADGTYEDMSEFTSGISVQRWWQEEYAIIDHEPYQAIPFDFEVSTKDDDARIQGAIKLFAYHKTMSAHARYGKTKADRFAKLEPLVKSEMKGLLELVSTQYTTEYIIANKAEIYEKISAAVMENGVDLAQTSGSSVAMIIGDIDHSEDVSESRKAANELDRQNGLIQKIQKDLQLNPEQAASHYRVMADKSQGKEATFHVITPDGFQGQVVMQTGGN